MFMFFIASSINFQHSNIKTSSGCFTNISNTITFIMFGKSEQCHLTTTAYTKIFEVVQSDCWIIKICKYLLMRSNRSVKQYVWICECIVDYSFWHIVWWQSSQIAMWQFTYVPKCCCLLTFPLGLCWGLLWTQITSLTFALCTHLPSNSTAYVVIRQNWLLCYNYII